jgi:hypothetical protein
MDVQFTIPDIPAIATCSRAPEERRRTRRHLEQTALSARQDDARSDWGGGIVVRDRRSRRPRGGDDPSIDPFYEEPWGDRPDGARHPALDLDWGDIDDERTTTSERLRTAAPS